MFQFSHGGDVSKCHREMFFDAENMNGIEIVNLETHHKLVGGFNLPLSKI